MDHRMLLGHPNRIGEATLSGGSWSAGLPLANLKDRQFAKVARSTDLALASTIFNVDLGQPRKLRILSLGAHNISLRGKVRYEAFTDSGLTNRVYDSGLKNAWGSVVGANWDITQLEWQSSNWYLGTFNAEEIEGFTAFTTEVLSEEVSAQYWRVSIADETNEAGFIQIGRPFFGPAWQPRINRSYGSGIGYETATSVQSALGGAEFFDRREPVRFMRFVLEAMQSDEAYGTALQLIRRAGISGEIFVIPDPSDPITGLYRNFMGRLRQLSALEEVAWMNRGVGHSMAFEIKELR